MHGPIRIIFTDLNYRINFFKQTANKNKTKSKSIGGGGGTNRVVRESAQFADTYTASLGYRNLLRSIRVYWCLRVNVQGIRIGRFCRANLCSVVQWTCVTIPLDGTWGSTAEQTETEHVSFKQCPLVTSKNFGTFQAKYRLNAAALRSRTGDNTQKLRSTDQTVLNILPVVRRITCFNRILFFPSFDTNNVVKLRVIEIVTYNVQ